jgi:GNAT superfamily N-acetyltransferase
MLDVRRSAFDVSFVTEKFQIRRATPQDAEIIAWHRARMFQDMGELSVAFEALRTMARPRIEEWLERGEYVGWLASCAPKPDVIIGGAGVCLHRILPRPRKQSGVSEGQQATIVNVFTEPEWRKRGVAALLLKEIIKWSNTESLDRLVLHASEEGRSLYDKLGFVSNNEMRFIGD